MKRFGCILLIALVGCGKKPPTTPALIDQVEPSPAVTSTPRSAPTAGPELPATPDAKPKSSVALEDQLQGTVHPEMTMRLRLFEQMKGRLPESFYELQNMGGFDSTPGLPANMKYMIDRKDKTVKIVKK